MTLRTTTAVTSHLLTSYRRTWKDSVFNSFIFPLCLLFGIGWSVGRHVSGDAGLNVSYFAFVGAGLLGASVMQVGAAESAWSVFGAFEWNRIYHAIKLTPAGPADILTGHLLAIVVRAVLAGAGFMVMMTVFGIGHRWSTLAVLPLLPLFAVAVAAPVMGFSATIASAGMYDILFRLGIVPMTLFTGVYFPVDSLPVVARQVAQVLPLTQAVGLSRMLVLGGFSVLPALAHLLILVAWAGAGFVLARRAFDRRLRE